MPCMRKRSVRMHDVMGDLTDKDERDEVEHAGGSVKESGQ